MARRIDSLPANGDEATLGSHERIGRASCIAALILSGNVAGLRHGAEEADDSLQPAAALDLGEFPHFEGCLAGGMTSCQP